MTTQRLVMPQSVLRFETEKKREGSTSVTYHIDVFARHIDSGDEEHVFHTDITFVRVGADGKKTALKQGA